MPLGNITVTAKIGPAIQVTTKLFNNVIDVDFQLRDGILRVIYMPTGTQTPVIEDFGLETITSVTYTIASGVATITVS